MSHRAHTFLGKAQGNRVKGGKKRSGGTVRGMVVRERGGLGVKDMQGVEQAGQIIWGRGSGYRGQPAKGGGEPEAQQGRDEWTGNL